mgnify:FL=1
MLLQWLFKVKLTNYTLTKNKKTVRKLYGIAGAIATLVIPLIIMHTNSHVETSQSLCPHKMLIGLPCPGCGITKSLIFFYKGDIMTSLSYHVLGPFVIILSFIVIAVLTTEIVTQREYFNTVLYSKRLAYILAVALAVYHIIRTIIFIANHTFT